MPHKSGYLQWQLKLEGELDTPMPPQTKKKWICQTVDAGDRTGDLILTLPPDMLEEVGWGKGTEIRFNVQPDGNCVLSESHRSRVTKRAQEVFGGEKSAKKWLATPIRALGGVTPLSLLESEHGFKVVMDALGRNEAGVVA